MNQWPNLYWLIRVYCKLSTLTLNSSIFLHCGSPLKACVSLKLAKIIMSHILTTSYTAIQLGDTDKPLKLISKWGSMLKRFSNAPLSSHSSELPTLYLRRNVFYPVNREELVSKMRHNYQVLITYHLTHNHTDSWSCGSPVSIRRCKWLMSLLYNVYNYEAI